MSADTTAGQHVVSAEGGAWHWVPDGQAAPAPGAAQEPAPQGRPNVQHVGMQDKAGIARIQSRNAATAAAEAKAATDPNALSYEEALTLTDPTFARLLNSGQLMRVTGAPGRRAKGSRR